MAGKLIVIEGLDGSGKSTQLERLPSVLKERGIEVRTVSFPDYNDPSSTLVKMYLAGEFGSDAGDVNAYAASIFYAADRYASFVRYWRDYYESGGAVLCGRYVSSNVIHQASKLPSDEWGAYMDWLYDLEFSRIGIPKPDLTIFLDMPGDVADRLMSGRYSGDESKKDLHEKNKEYLKNCRAAASYAAERLGWQTVSCAENGDPLPLSVITAQLADSIEKAVKA